MGKSVGVTGALRRPGTDPNPLVSGLEFEVRVNWHARNPLLMNGGFWPFMDMWHSCGGSHIEEFIWCDVEGRVSSWGYVLVLVVDHVVLDSYGARRCLARTYPCRADGWSRTSRQKKVAAEGANQQVSSSRKMRTSWSPKPTADF